MYQAFPVLLAVVLLAGCVTQQDKIALSHIDGILAASVGQQQSVVGFDYGCKGPGALSEKSFKAVCPGFE